MTGLLQELVQNAEDAGAKEVRFLYDRNTFGQDPRYLQHPDLASYQVGPCWSGTVFLALVQYICRNYVDLFRPWWWPLGPRAVDVAHS